MSGKGDFEQFVEIRITGKASWLINNYAREQSSTLLLYRLHTALLHWPLSSAATMEVRPGPRHNRKEDPGSSIFSMLVVYGYYLHLLTSSQNQVTGKTSVDPFPPPSNQPGLSPHPLPPGYLLHHLQR
jgi:hypothetical protein